MQPKTNKFAARSSLGRFDQVAGLLLGSWVCFGHPGVVLAAPSPETTSAISASSFGASPGESSASAPAVRAPTEPPPFDPSTPPAINPADVKLSAIPSNSTLPALPKSTTSFKQAATESPDRSEPPNPKEGEPAEPVIPTEQIAPPPASKAHTAATSDDHQAPSIVPPAPRAIIPDTPPEPPATAPVERLR